MLDAGPARAPQVAEWGIVEGVRRLRLRARPAFGGECRSGLRLASHGPKHLARSSVRYLPCGPRLAPDGACKYHQLNINKHFSTTNRCFRTCRNRHEFGRRRTGWVQLPAIRPRAGSTCRRPGANRPEVPDKTSGQVLSGSSPRCTGRSAAVRAASAPSRRPSTHPLSSGRSTARRTRAPTSDPPCAA
jgi:hypothetical protein